MFGKTFNASKAYNAVGKINLKDIKGVIYKIDDLKNTVDQIFNSVMNTPLEEPVKRFASKSNTFQGNMFIDEKPRRFGEDLPGRKRSSIAPVETTISRKMSSNVSKTLFRTENIRTFADALDYLAAERKVNITYGIYETTIDRIYSISPNIFIHNNTDDVWTLHFNIDASRHRLPEEHIIRLLEGLSALISFFETIGELLDSKDNNIKIHDNDISVEVDKNIYVSLGTLFLVNYALKMQNYAYGSKVLINAFQAVVDSSHIVISSDKYKFDRVYILGDTFLNIISSMPIFELLEINDDVFSEYQENTKGLSARLIIEANKKYNTTEYLSEDDITIIDLCADANIKKSILGKEIIKSEEAQ